MLSLNQNGNSKELQMLVQNLIDNCGLYGSLVSMKRKLRLNQSQQLVLDKAIAATEPDLNFVNQYPSEKIIEVLRESLERKENSNGFSTDEINQLSELLK